VWSDLHIGVRLTLAADLIGAASQVWWHDGTARLQALFDTDRFRPASGNAFAIVDESAATTTRIG
jgi:hypothetical protein